MADVAYRFWSLIPIDREPSTQRPTVTNPPQLTAIAVDAGASLFFELAKPVDALQIKLSVTGITAEGRSDELLQVYIGGAEGTLQAQAVSWDRSQDALDAVFTTTVAHAGTSLKLHLPEGPTLIANTIELTD